MNPIAIKRFTLEETIRRGTKRYQRRFPTNEDAIAAAERWLGEPGVKAVWAYGTEDEELLFKTKEAST